VSSPCGSVLELSHVLQESSKVSNLMKISKRWFRYHDFFPSFLPIIPSPKTTAINSPSTNTSGRLGTMHGRPFRSFVEGECLSFHAGISTSRPFAGPLLVSVRALSEFELGGCKGERLSPPFSTQLIQLSFVTTPTP